MSNEKIGTTNTDDATPESLMDNFKGPGMMKVVVVTVVIHVVVLVGASLPYLKKSLLGEDTTSLTKEERIDRAVLDATSSLRKIAKEHGLNPQDISDQFTSSGSRSAKKAVPRPEVKAGAVEPLAPSATPKSTIEEELEKKAVGPAMPELGGEDQEEDLFGT